MNVPYQSSRLVRHLMNANVYMCDIGSDIRDDDYIPASEYPNARATGYLGHRYYHF